MPDFRMQPSFPIASVIEAAQKNAQLQTQSRLAGQQSLIEGLQSIGQIGQSIVDRRRSIAQSLALGRQFGIPDDQSKLMEPDQVLKAATIKQGQSSVGQYMLMLHPELKDNPSFLAAMSGNSSPQGASGTADGAMPASGANPTPSSSGGAMLTSDTTATPIAPSPLSPPTTGQSPVPIQPPPSMPPGGAPSPLNQPVTKGTLNMLRLGLANRPEYVMTKDAALAQGSVPKGTKIVDPATDEQKSQQKSEQDFDKQLMMAVRSRSSSLGIEDRKVNQAIHLRQLFNQHYDPKTGQYNIPNVLYNDIALGLATLASPTASAGPELLNELRQRTAKGDFAGALTYLGVTDDNGNIPTGSTQAIFKMVKDNIDRQGKTAEDLRNQEFDTFKQLAPMNARPEWVESRRKVRLGNSYNDFISKSPDMVQNMPANGAWTSDKEQRYQELLQKQKGKSNISL